MMRLTLSIFIGLSFFYSCAQQPASLSFEAAEQINTTQKFVLTDYLSNNESLDKEVARIFASMDDTAIVAQLIMPAVGRLGESRDSIDKFIRLRLIGGVLMLNGTKDEFTSWIESFEKSNKLIGNLPFLYSADAEPSAVINPRTSVIRL
jgi:beta-N-acetylhexosaminidase